MEEGGSNSQTIDEDELMDEYEVESIVDHKSLTTGRFFFVKWKGNYIFMLSQYLLTPIYSSLVSLSYLIGYPSERNTWEPAERLRCPDKIQEYKNRVRKERGMDILIWGIS